ncbi:hypothetical protein KTT_32100 [Tengunoibacter tsumagoiensis]|uniref:Uncharacterized protein n=1 Tax=Tengunoibacter tsumagoiensis TaxID=2014871 RepID=A0A402A2W3_9CHLR|nr:hypothetical protein KTT_32100 [Tengunoibacter tsumagoiensis]
MKKVSKSIQLRIGLLVAGALLAVLLWSLPTENEGYKIVIFCIIILALLLTGIISFRLRKRFNKKQP